MTPHELMQNEPAGLPAVHGEEFSLLVERGILRAEALEEAADIAQARGIDLELVLLNEYHVAKRDLLAALSAHYHCLPIEYDERLPVPPELLAGLSSDSLFTFQWMPVIWSREGTAVIAARDPRSRAMRDDVKKHVHAERFEFRVALGPDIQWFIQDFLHSRPGSLIGTERTGLAFWRNTMALWRTRMACYRTDLAGARTGLAFLRWGLGTIALSNAVARESALQRATFLGMLALGACLSLYGLAGYLRVRRSRLSPPGHHTLVEVTAATVQFLDAYHAPLSAGAGRETPGTMLARMGDLLAEYSTYLNPAPSSRTRTMLARERNVLAAQRTIAACYRTIYARARTGLAFIRTGTSFIGIGIGILSLSGGRLFVPVNAALIFAGAIMLADGLHWYWPVRKEQAELPRSPAPFD